VQKSNDDFGKGVRGKSGELFFLAIKKMKNAALSAGAPAKGERLHLETISDAHLAPDTIVDYYRDAGFLADAIGYRQLEGEPVNVRLDIMTQRLSQKTFLLMMMRIAPYYSVSRLEKFEAAVAHFQQRYLKVARGFPLEAKWTQLKEFSRDFAGVKTLCLRGESRGAILLPMKDQLVRYALGKGHVMYAWGYAIAYDGLLRHGDVEDLTVDCIVPSEDEGPVVLTIIGGKGDKGPSTDERHGIADEVQYVRIQSTEAKSMCKILKMRHLQGAELVFRGWKRHVANALIQECAGAHGWSTKLRWSFHCLRHGHAAQMKMDGIDVGERMLRGRWKSKQVCEHYSRINEPSGSK